MLDSIRSWAVSVYITYRYVSVSKKVRLFLFRKVFRLDCYGRSLIGWIESVPTLVVGASNGFVQESVGKVHQFKLVLNMHRIQRLCKLLAFLDGQILLRRSKVRIQRRPIAQQWVRADGCQGTCREQGCEK